MNIYNLNLSDPRSGFTIVELRVSEVHIFE